MDKLYGWRARRAGGRITVTHSCGKIANIDSIEIQDGRIIATQASDAAPGREFELAVPTGNHTAIIGGEIAVLVRDVLKEETRHIASSDDARELTDFAGMLDRADTIRIQR